MLPFPKYYEDNLDTYITFVRDVRDKVINENPDLTFSEITRKIGKMWTKLTKQEKRVYNQKRFLATLESMLEHSLCFSYEDQYNIVGQIDLEDLDWRTYLFNRNLSAFKMLEKEVESKKEEIEMVKKMSILILKNTNIGTDVINYCIFNYF